MRNLIWASFVSPSRFQLEHSSSPVKQGRNYPGNEGIQELLSQTRRMQGKNSLHESVKAVKSRFAWRSGNIASAGVEDTELKF